MKLTMVKRSHCVRDGILRGHRRTAGTVAVATAIIVHIVWTRRRRRHFSQIIATKFCVAVVARVFGVRCGATAKSCERVSVCVLAAWRPQPPSARFPGREDNFRPRRCSVFREIRRSRQASAAVAFAYMLYIARVFTHAHTHTHIIRKRVLCV